MVEVEELDMKLNECGGIYYSGKCKLTIKQGKALGLRLSHGSERCIYLDEKGRCEDNCMLVINANTRKQFKMEVRKYGKCN